MSSLSTCSPLLLCYCHSKPPHKKAPGTHCEYAHMCAHIHTDVHSVCISMCGKYELMAVLPMSPSSGFLPSNLPNPVLWQYNLAPISLYNKILCQLLLHVLRLLLLPHCCRSPRPSGPITSRCPPQAPLCNPTVATSTAVLCTEIKSFGFQLLRKEGRKTRNKSERKKIKFYKQKYQKREIIMNSYMPIKQITRRNVYTPWYIITYQD